MLQLIQEILQTPRYMGDEKNFNNLGKAPSKNLVYWMNDLSKHWVHVGLKKKMPKTFEISDLEPGVKEKVAPAMLVLCDFSDSEDEENKYQE